MAHENRTWLGGLQWSFPRAGSFAIVAAHMTEVRRPVLALALALACCLSVLCDRVGASPRPRHSHAHHRSRSHKARNPHRQDTASSDGAARVGTAMASARSSADVGPVTREHELEASGSESIGRASRGGRLASGIALLPCDHRAVKSTGTGNHFGTAELVGMLEHATRTVAARFEGSHITIGDLSRSTGGRLKHHRSHRSGRDADVGFYFVAEDGTPHRAEQFVRVFADGTTAEGQRFDVARNWELLRSMIEFNGARLQYVFVSRPIQHLLLTHAAESGASPDLLERARDLMSHYARGHDNHFHVRIHCPEGDSLCVDQEPPRRPSRHSRSRRGHGHGHTDTAVCTWRSKRPDAPKRSVSAARRRGRGVRGRGPVNPAETGRPRARAAFAAPPCPRVRTPHPRGSRRNALRGS